MTGAAVARDPAWTAVGLVLAAALAVGVLGPVVAVAGGAFAAPPAAAARGPGSGPDAAGPGADAPGPGAPGPGAGAPGPDAPGPDAPGPDAPGPGAGTAGAPAPHDPLATWRRVLPLAGPAALGSLRLALAATAGAVLLGLPLAVLAARVRLPGQGALHALALLALLSPPFLGAYAWVLLLGARGALRPALAALGLDLPPFRGPGAAAFALALHGYPYVYLLGLAALRGVDRGLEEAAATLGAGPWTVLRRVTLPLALPGFAAGALVCFVTALADLGTPLVLSPEAPALAPLAYRLYTSEVARSPGPAAAVSAVLALLALAGLGLLRLVAGRRRVDAARPVRPIAPAPVPGPRGALCAATAWGIALAGAAPLAVVVVTSFRATRGPVLAPGWGLESWRHALGAGGRALGNSVLYAGAAALLVALVGALVGYLVARRPGRLARALEVLVALPWVVPGVVLGLGLVLLLGAAAPWALGTGAAIVLACVLRRLPYATRACAAALAQVHPSVEDAAATLGAAPPRAFARVVLPLIAPGVLAGAALGWITAINELSASLVLYTGRTVTLPVKVYLAVADGDFGPAAAFATMLLLATAGGLALAGRALDAGA